MILITAIGSLSLIIWAVAPALMKSITRPPGDGTNIETYRFDLTNCLVEKSLIVPAMLHRDMVPIMSNPSMPRFLKILVGRVLRPNRRTRPSVNCVNLC